MNTYDTLLKSESVQQFEGLIRDGHSVVAEELLPSAKAFLAAHASAISNKSLLILTGAGPEEFKLFNDLPFFRED